MAGGAKTGLRRVKAAHVLRRCFTLEDPPTAAFPDDVGGRRVVRAASEEEAWASPLEADGEADMTAAKKWRRPARHSAPPSRCASTPPSPGAPTGGRVRREAWAGPAGSQSKVENVETPTKPAKSKSHARPKSCVTPVSSHKAKAAEGDDADGAKAPSISKAKKQSPKRPPEEPPPATPTPSIQIKISSAEETQAALPPPSVPDHPSAPPASDKVPKVPQQTRKTSPTEPGVRNKGDLEPYDGLSVQKAPILPQASKREGGGTPSSSLSDNQEDNDDALSTSSQKLKGYKPKNGFEFLPFSKLFTKPSSRYSSRSSSCDPDLGVENTYHQFNDCEKEIISKTRTALKQRITSANQRRISNTKNKKIHLNIVVNAQPDSDDSALFSDPEEAQAPRRPLSADSGTKRKNKTKNAKTKDRDLPPPPQTIKKTPKEPILNKKQALKSDSNKPHDKKDETRPRDTAKRIRKREIPTIMSEISPVPSDIEQEIIVPPPRLSTSSASVRNHHNRHQNNRLTSDSDDNNCINDDNLFVPARGGLLRTIINDANGYKPVTKTWRGNKMHLEVRIKTERAASSTEEDAEDDHEKRWSFQDRRKPRMIRPAKRGGVSSAVGKMLAVRSMAGLLLPTCSDPKNASATPTPAVLRARERDKLRRILEVCAAKVEEAKQLSERLSADGVWISLDTLQRGLMSPTEYRVYQDHLRTLAEKEQQKRRPVSKRIPSPYRR